MSKTETVYDSTDYQMESLSNLRGGDLTIKDISKPETVSILIERHFVTLTELKSVKSEVIDLKSQVNILREERTNLKVDLARSGERETILWLEIPLSFLGGFAINLITGKEPESIKIGWFLLIVSLLMLVFLRLAPIIKSYRKTIDNKGEINEN